jgi:hypothetical protein
MSGDGLDRASAGKCDEQLVVHPRKRLWHGHVGSTGATAGWMLASLLYSLQFHAWARLIVVATGVALAVGVIGLMRLSYRRMKLTMIGDRLIFTRLLHDRVVLAGGLTGRVVDVEVAWGRASGRRSRFWLLINGTGRTVVGLNRQTWDDGQLERLRESLGLPIEIIEMPKRPTELRKAYPGTLPWWLAYPSAATLVAIITVATVVLALQRLAS